MRRPCEALEDVLKHAEDIFNIVHCTNGTNSNSDATKRSGIKDTDEEPKEKRTKDELKNC